MIEVFVSDLEIAEAANSAIAEWRATNKMREAGIPVIGVLTWRGVESGHLYWWPEHGGWTFKWKP